jgi:hypothetical protein
MIDIEKSFRDGKPVTTFHLTDAGRQRLTQHVDQLIAAVQPQPDARTRASDLSDTTDEPWID